jgi:hypothetical protein
LNVGHLGLVAVIPIVSITHERNNTVKIQGAVVKEQGITFAIVIVKPPAMQTAQDSAKTRATFQGLFPGFQLVLASQDSRGTFSYQGRKDLVGFLASIDASRIPWKEYTFS